MDIMDLDTEDTAHKFLVSLAKNGKRSVKTLLGNNRQVIKDLSVKDVEGKTLSFDDWKVS